MICKGHGLIQRANGAVAVGEDQPVMGTVTACEADRVAAAATSRHPSILLAIQYADFQ